MGNVSCTMMFHTVRDKMTATYVSDEQAVRTRHKRKNNEMDAINDVVDHFPIVMQILEFLYIATWTLSWLAAITSIEHSYRHNDADKDAEGEWGKIDQLTPLLIACQKTLRVPQKLIQVIECYRIHGGTKTSTFTAKRVVWGLSTLVKSAMWSVSAIYIGEGLAALWIVYAITFLVAAMVWHGTRDKYWPTYMQLMSIAPEVKEALRAEFAPLRFS